MAGLIFMGFCFLIGFLADQRVEMQRRAGVNS